MTLRSSLPESLDVREVQSFDVILPEQSFCSEPFQLLARSDRPSWDRLGGEGP